MTDRDDKRNCVKCSFFVSTGDILGVCKRYPQWVNKHTADWCGEFEAKQLNRKNQLVENFAQILTESETIVDEVTAKRRGRPPKAKEAA